MNQVYQDYIVSQTGLLIVSREKGKYGVINLENEELIPFQYNWIEDFDPKHNLFAFFDKRGGKRQRIIDKDGNVILRSNYEYISHFQEGLAVVGRHKNGKATWEYGFINLEGELVIPFQYSNVIYHFKDGEAVVISAEKGKITIQKSD